ncbi:DUF4873 domain-containing protein [Solihabitans fulvus]|uniref:DUF4873 domain-containing protein n=1 Tax=Solihabitans fulvus TaxID=1892852 RepID=A0A5B2XMF1_9PSEU|nr:DUF4873 domain-containing protein [Solihabitans fulvus]KAA2264089.1 DUF4873 domain-containing protein [Solihabitans fulvus]
MTEHEHDAPEHDAEEGYEGPANLVTETGDIPVDVLLRGYFQPIDGRYHWYGRITAKDEVTALAQAGTRSVLLRTPQGEATGTLSDPDPWQRYRVAGTSTPPFTVASA